ncbi:hypothetical protein HOH51_01430 [bacterium]|nr:hypothetical protein [bacterium]
MSDPDFSLSNLTFTERQQLKQVLIIAKLFMIQDAERNFVRVNERIEDMLSHVDRGLLDKNGEFREGLLPLFGYFNVSENVDFRDVTGRDVSFLAPGLKIQQVLLDFTTEITVETLILEGNDAEKVERKYVRIRTVLASDGDVSDVRNVFVPVDALESQVQIEMFQHQFESKEVMDMDLKQLYSKINSNKVASLILSLDSIYHCYGQEVVHDVIKRCFEAKDVFKVIYLLNRVLKYTNSKLVSNLILENVYNAEVLDDVVFWHNTLLKHFGLDFFRDLIDAVLLTNQKTTLFSLSSLKILQDKLGLGKEIGGVLPRIRKEKLWDFFFLNIIDLKNIASDKELVSMLYTAVDNGAFDNTLNVKSLQNLQKFLDVQQRSILMDKLIKSKFWNVNLDGVKVLIKSDVFSESDLLSLYKSLVSEKKWDLVFMNLIPLSLFVEEDVLYEKFWWDLIARGIGRDMGLDRKFFVLLHSYIDVLSVVFVKKSKVWKSMITHVARAAARQHEKRFTASDLDWEFYLEQ